MVRCYEPLARSPQNSRSQKRRGRSPTFRDRELRRLNQQFHDRGFDGSESLDPSNLNVDAIGYNIIIPDSGLHIHLSCADLCLCRWIVK